MGTTPPDSSVGSHPLARRETVRTYALKVPLTTVPVMLHHIGASIELVGCYPLRVVL